MLRRLELQVERLDRRRHGKVVQGHVDEAGVAPRGERRRAPRDVLPAGPTRPPAVHLRTHAPPADPPAPSAPLLPPPPHGPPPPPAAPPPAPRRPPPPPP